MAEPSLCLISILRYKYLVPTSWASSLLCPRRSHYQQFIGTHVKSVVTQLNSFNDASISNLGLTPATYKAAVANVDKLNTELNLNRIAKFDTIGGIVTANTTSTDKKKYPYMTVQ